MQIVKAQNNIKQAPNQISYTESIKFANYHIEIQLTKQMLINNKYSNHMLDSQIRKFLNRNNVIILSQSNA